MVGVTIKSASNGRFEVMLDDELLFSKAQLRRFPERGEVEQILEKRGLGPALDWK